MPSNIMIRKQYVKKQPYCWSYTVDTRLYDNTETNAKTSIPFELEMNNTSITVDWGDGNKNTYTNANYSGTRPLNNTSNTIFIHTYSTPGIYTVKIYSDDFDKVTMYNYNYATTGTPIYYYRKTIIAVNNALPTLDGTTFSNCFRGCGSLTSIPTDLFRYNTQITNFSSCFHSCSSLIIPSDIFKYNIEATNFQYCFGYCNMTSLPSGLFAYNINATSFANCFEGCTSLISIPSGLFDNCTKATTFGACFASCYALNSIPEHLFDNNTLVTNFNGCFKTTAIEAIPSDLFKFNTVVSTFNATFQSCSSLNGFTLHIGSLSVSTVTNFVTNKTGVTRTVYVPTGSTTQTTFNNAGTTLGLTIIAE